MGHPVICKICTIFRFLFLFFSSRLENSNEHRLWLTGYGYHLSQFKIYIHAHIIAVTMYDLWGVVLFSSAEVYWCFGGTCYLHLQVWSLQPESVLIVVVDSGALHAIVIQLLRLAPSNGPNKVENGFSTQNIVLFKYIWDNGQPFLQRHVSGGQ